MTQCKDEAQIEREKMDRLIARALEGLHAAPEAHTIADWLCVGMFPFLIVLGSLAT